MNWDSAQNDWQQVLAHLDAERFRLQCSYTGAWFRGLVDGSFSLLPSLLREQSRGERLETSEAQEREELRKRIKSKSEEIRRRRQELLDLRSAIRNPSNPSDVSSLLAGYDELAQMRQGFDRSTREMHNLKSSLNSLGVLRRSEAEAFHEFYFRSGLEFSSSWEVLAEMQHAGVPTRLLDWTETPLNAFYFAVEPYISALAIYWQKLVRDRRHREYPYLSKTALEAFIADEIARCNGESLGCTELRMLASKMGGIPRIWVLNAVQCSFQQTGKYRVWDVTQDKALDYYNSFIIQKNWPFRLPVPIYSPWRRPRIAAQRGMFTVHGRSGEPLDRIHPVDKKHIGVLGFVDLTGDSVIGAAKHLLTFCGLDHYSMFRDLDNLAKRIKVHFFPRDRDVV